MTIQLKGIIKNKNEKNATKIKVNLIRELNFNI